MKRLPQLAVILFVSSISPWHSCEAGDGTVTGDTRYKYSQSEKVSEKPSESSKVVQAANVRTTTRRVAPRWRHLGAHWYYSRAGEVPWWPNAPGD
jgi:hypothetical protein